MTADIRRDRPFLDADALAGRLALIEGSREPAVALAGEYPDGHKVTAHRHGRAQLLHALAGVVTVATRAGRWMVPPDHAMWIPAGTEHSVEMLGDVSMRSVYVREDAGAELPAGLRVMGMSDLMRSLLIEAVAMGPAEIEGRRRALLLDLLVEEISHLPERPLGLPMPADARLAALCRGFLAAPSARATIDGWAESAGMSRRTFTRAFARETGLGLSAWRQQACLFAALPRLADGEPITIVALDLGYDSVPAFITMFKRMLGMAPRAYLRGAMGGETGAIPQPRRV
ncbi:MAG: helix-turn-helix transcriptional regulator [Mesorhizobium sp.]|nr:helix-turn-helix transcriptional regulator [Mesorhizobium sp.]